MSLSTTKLFNGDQFVGYKVDPSTGDLVLRYVMVITNKPDANGRGVTTRVMESNKTIARGRPLIFAPNEKQGGTRGHTDFRTTDPYKYEIGRIVNIEPASNNLMSRLRNNMIQTNSSYISLLENEKDLWVADVIITNDQAKSIFLNPATSHLIPRYVSPSFIHARNPKGDYSKVDDAILDHVAIVNKPTFSSNGLQIDGAAYGEITRLRGACFGDKIACLNLLQTSSNKVVELEKCVSCPVQLLDRLTELYKNLDIIQIEQSSSQVMSSTTENNNNNNNNQAAQSQVTTTTTNPSTNKTVTDNTPITTGQTQIQSPLGNLFKSDEQLQQNYNALKGLLTQMVKEDPKAFREAIIDSNESNNNNNTNITPQTPTATAEQANQQSNNNNNNQNQNAENLQTGETPQISVSQQQYKDALEKLNIKEEELKNMKTEDILKRLGDVKGVLTTVLQEQEKTSRTLQQIRDREEKSKIANILPREAFQDERGFKQKEFDDMVNYLHKVKLDHQYIAILGVGLATMKNEQLRIKEQQINLKKGNLPQGFGESIKQKLAEQQQQPATINVQNQ